MARHRYLIHYPNGFKEHVSRTDLLRMSNLTRISDREYSSPVPAQQDTSPDFYPGIFKFKLRDKTSTERLESAGAMASRLSRAGVLA